MADFQPPLYTKRSSSALSKKSLISNGSNGYEDVFGGPPKFSVPTFAPRIEDYGEIFGCFGPASKKSSASMIPYLDFAGEDEATFEIRSSSKSFDYGQVFGGLNGVDFAVSYEEMLLESKKGEMAPENSRMPDGVKSQLQASTTDSRLPSEEHYVDAFCHLEQNECLSNGDLNHVDDGVKQFNLSYHKSNQRSHDEDSVNRTMHVAELHEVSGFTYVVNACPPPQKTSCDKPKPPIADDLCPGEDSYGEIMEGNHFKETSSTVPVAGNMTKVSGNDHREEKQQFKSKSSKSGGDPETDSHISHDSCDNLKLSDDRSYPKKAFLTISDISLRTQPSRDPPPSRPPPKLAIKQGDCNRMMDRNLRSHLVEEHFWKPSTAHGTYSSGSASETSALEEAVKDSSSCFFDVEVDVSSAAAASAAAMKEAMEKAQARLKSAKQSMERKKFQNLLKPGLDDSRKGKETREAPAAQENHKCTEERAGEWKAEKQFFEFVKDDTVKGSQGVPLQEKNKQLNATGKVHEHEYEKKVAKEMSGLAKNDKLTATKEATLVEENGRLSKGSKEAQDGKENEKKLKAAAGDSHQQEENDEKRLKLLEVQEKLKAAAEIFENENNKKKLKAVLEAREQEENDKKVRAEAREREENEKKLMVAREWEENEKRLKVAREACEWEENDKRLKASSEREENERRLKVAQEAHEWGVKEKRLKAAQEAWQWEENERRLKAAQEAHEQEENERRLKAAQEAFEREENEKRLKAAQKAQQEENERRLKVAQEAHEQEENEKRLKAAQEAREREENEKRLKAAQEARERKENEKRLKAAQEAREWEENEKRLKAAQEAREREENEKRLKAAQEACEREENEKRLKAAQEAREMEENEKRLKAAQEAREREENEKRLKAAQEAREREENKKRLKAAQEAREREENEKRLKAAQAAREREENEKRLKAAQEAREWEENEKRLKAAQEARKREENEKRLKAAQAAREREENEKRLKAAQEAREQEENEKRLKAAQEAREREENEKRLKAAHEREENEKRLKAAQEAHKWEENERLKAAQEAREREEDERRLKAADEVAHEWEENERHMKEIEEGYDHEENEKRIKDAQVACENEGNDKRLKTAHVAQEHEETVVRLKASQMAQEHEENEWKLEAAQEAPEWEENQVRSMATEEARDQEEIVKGQKTAEKAHECEENERKLKGACKLSENILKATPEVFEWEEHGKKVKATQWAHECEENSEKVMSSPDNPEWEEMEKLKIAHEGHELEQNEKKLKAALADQEEENEKKVDGECESVLEEELKATPGGFHYKGKEKSLKAVQEAHEREEVQVKAAQEALHCEEEMGWKAVKVTNQQEKNCKELKINGKATGQDINAQDEESKQLKTIKDTSGDEQHSKGVKAGEAVCLQGGEMKLEACHMLSEQDEKMKSKAQVHDGEHRKEVKSAHEPYRGEENGKNHVTESEKAHYQQGDRNRMKAAQQEKLLEEKENMTRTVSVSIENKFTTRKGQSANEIHVTEVKAKEERKRRELEMERVRRLEEERDREREREKDRILVERATREARDRAFLEARERAERSAVERATAEARQRAFVETREKAEKASAGAREKLLAEKAAVEARLKAERAAVERATAEARERALGKALAEKAALGAKREDKYSGPESSSGTSQRYPNSLNQASYANGKHQGAEVESAKRCQARLERHQRTVERAAKALAEKNVRDILAQREQAERNRLSETLDAEVRRWSNGKEGNLRALLSTLQYILGPDSGWQPIPLTDVITAAAVKRAYRKATLSVHPDKVQQRGASIQQKYICEKVFDLLKEAWNKFNSEER